MTKSEIIAELTALGIPAPSSATKAELEGMLAAASDHPSSEPSSGRRAGPRPVWEGGETRAQFQERLRAWKRGH